jgi:probable lipoprotein NlpC
MRKAYGVVVCLLVSVLILSANIHAENRPLKAPGSTGEETDFLLHTLDWRNLLSLHGNRGGRASGEWSPIYNREFEIVLFEAVKNRLGIPYRVGGVDDRGYDCSGFVWRVFQEAGIDFVRSPARLLWETLPPAEPRDQTRFGTLVFFNGLGHVGIVRDGTSFYHASSSQGVVRSYFDKYWAERIVGFRRIYIPMEMQKGARKNEILAERTTKPAAVAAKTAKRSPANAERDPRLGLNSMNRQQIKMAAEVSEEKPAKKKKGFFRWLLR